MFLLLFSHLVMSDSLWPYEQQHTKLPCPSPGPWSLLKLVPIEFVILYNHLILCCPLFLMPSIFSSIRVFPNESALCIRWPKYWSFGLSVGPSNEYSGLISYGIDLFDLLIVQGTLKDLLQLHSSKASILLCSVFFMVHNLTSIHDYWKNHSFDYMDHLTK